jgi:hypothetical protein
MNSGVIDGGAVCIDCIDDDDDDDDEAAIFK